MNHRTLFFSIISILVGCGGVQAVEPGASAAAIKAWRRAALERPRRIIFNNDGSEITLIKEPTAKALLALRLTPLIGTQVDTLFCATTHGFGLFAHFTKVGQMFALREGIYGPGQSSENFMPALIAAGIDPLRVNLDFARAHGMEMFCSFRMNDTHDGSTRDYGPIRFRYNQVKSQHPEYLLGAAGENLKHGKWTAVNYARPEIRDLMYSYIEEVCRNYDIDGVELDFFRHPVFFKSTARGEPATPAERQAMTSLLQRIRTMADTVGRQRGRPLLIAVHVPDSVEYSRAIGLELDEWLKTDLVDILVVAGYFQLNPWGYSVDLARQYGVKVFPSMDQPGLMDPEARTLRGTPLTHRARAAVAWNAGVDGIYMFNFQPSSEEAAARDFVPRVLGDRATLRELDKDYFANYLGHRNGRGNYFPFTPWLKIETLHPEAPKAVAPGGRATAEIEVAEDFSRRKPASLTLRLRFDHQSGATAAPVAAFNGKTLALQGSNGAWREFRLDPSTVRMGTNEIMVTSSGSSLQWSDAMLAVRWPAAAQAK